MRILRPELRKTNICPYCIAAAAIFLCLLGLSFLFAYVPKLESGSQSSAVLFSSYSGIMAVNGAIALMAFSALSSAMGYRYVIREYCGVQAILLFSYPISPKRILTAKTLLLMMFTSVAAIGSTLCSFTAFAMAASALSLVEDQLVFAHFVTALHNSIMITCLACGITLCSIRIGFARRSNSMTVISAILFSMLLTNFVAAIDAYFAGLFLFTVILLLTGILLMWNLAIVWTVWSRPQRKEGVEFNMRLTKIEKSMMNTYLLLTFSIAWGTELLLILLYRTPLSTGAFLQVLYYIGLGFGCGMAPAYAAFIAERKYHGMTLRSFLRKVIETHSMKRCLGVLLLFSLIQFCACALQERYTGNPCYLFVLFMPLMIYGGGMEEVGWQGILQPLLQKRFPFLIAVLMEGAVWSIWHLPLWFIPASSQSTYSFAAFTLFCITLGATLAAAHRITKSIWVSVLLHAWSNTVLGGMYTLTSLCSFPNMRTLTISAIQILVVMGLAYLMKTKP